MVGSPDGSIEEGVAVPFIPPPVPRIRGDFAPDLGTRDSGSHVGFYTSLMVFTVLNLLTPTRYVGLIFVKALLTLVSLAFVVVVSYPNDPGSGFNAMLVTLAWFIVLLAVQYLARQPSVF